MAERKKPVLAVGWGQLDQKSGYEILELGDPRRAIVRVSTSHSMVTGRSKDWDVVRSHAVKDVKEDIGGIYVSKFSDLIGCDVTQAMNWLAMGWAVKLGVRSEGELRKAI